MFGEEYEEVLNGKYLGERIYSKYTVKLYHWKERFYEVSFEYCDDDIWSIKPLEDESTIELYIEAMNRTGIPEIAHWDQIENLREAGKLYNLS